MVERVRADEQTSFICTLDIRILIEKSPLSYRRKPEFCADCCIFPLRAWFYNETVKPESVLFHF